MKKEFYTAGELAKLTGVSYKTIRHYHRIGLMEPEQYTESGYRQYGMKSIEALQRILMLKYLNFSLEEIKRILSEEEISETFSRQEKLLQAQMEHLEQLLKAVKEIQKVSGAERWDKMLMIMHATQQKEEIIKQYKESGNLQKRINIHVYSTSKTSWYQWVLDGLELQRGMKILEIGCGNGELWAAMYDQLPEDLQIVMTDSSENMLQAAKQKMEVHSEYFRQMNIQFFFIQKDAEDFKMEEDNFHRIIANHMLYHVTNENRPKLLETCKKMLREDGMFYASTVGNTHLQELYPLMKGFEEKIEIPRWMMENFELENGGKQLERIFSRVTMEEQENDLLVPDPQAIYDYIESLPGNGRELLKGRQKECMEYLESKVSEETPYFIHKSAGAFKAFK